MNKKTHLAFLVILISFRVIFAEPVDLDFNHPENSPLYFGNPSDSVCELSSEENYLLEKSQFVISYNNKTFCPNWVGWHLSASDIGESGRSNKFKADNQLPENWYHINQTDYKFNMYGFDRGHVCPSADRTANPEDNQITFLMTNMVPQSPDNNRIVWVALESYERELALAGNELYIFAGPYGKGGIGQKGQFDEIPVELSDGTKININVPSYTWKIILCIPEGENDAERVNENTTVIAVNVPNIQGCQNGGGWEQYKTTIDEIENLTGFDFFELIDDKIEDVLERR